MGIYNIPVSRWVPSSPLIALGSRSGRRALIAHDNRGVASELSWFSLKILGVKRISSAGVASPRVRAVKDTAIGSEALLDIGSLNGIVGRLKLSQDFSRGDLGVKLTNYILNLLSGPIEVRHFYTISGGGKIDLSIVRSRGFWLVSCTNCLVFLAFAWLGKIERGIGDIFDFIKV